MAEGLTANLTTNGIDKRDGRQRSPTSGDQNRPRIDGVRLHATRQVGFEDRGRHRDTFHSHARFYGRSWGSSRPHDGRLTSKLTSNGSEQARSSRRDCEARISAGCNDPPVGWLR